jgi:autotransporter-associated beta strand protein
MAMAISGTGSIIQNGSGTLELNGPNSYQGGTTLNDGTLKLGNATALGTGTLTINGCALDSGVASLVLTNDNVQVWNSNFNFAGSNDLNLGIGDVSLGSTAGVRTFTVDAGILTVGGIISNGTATALTKAGLGTLVLGGANNYSGGTAINAGTVTVNDGATLGASTGALAVNNPNPGTGTAVVLNINGNVSTGPLSGTIAVPATNTATINIAATKALTVNQTTNGVYDGTIAGDGKLVKGGGSMLTLSSANTFAGGTTLNDGTLSVNSLSNLGTSGTIRVNSGTFQYTGSDVVSTNRFLLQGGTETFDITQSAASLTITQQYGSSTIIKNGLGTLALGGNVGWDQVNPGQLTLSVDEGTMLLGANATDAGFMAVVNVVSDVKTGATLKLATGVGSRQFNVNGGNSFAMSGGTFDINGNGNNYERQISGTGEITNSSTTTASLNILPDGINTFGGNIVDGGTGKVLGVQFAGGNGYGANPAAVWTLSGINTYSGATTAGGGTLKAGSTTAFSPNSAYTVSATLDLDGNSNQIAGLTGAGTVKSSTGLAAVLTVNNDVATSNADFTFGGVLRDGTGPEGGGVFGLTKTGSKILTLTGANLYTGNTTISNGTLALTGSGSIASSPIIDVASLGIFDVAGVSGGYTLGASQTLKGSGTVIGPMTVAGTLSPGASTGTIYVTGATTLNGTFSVDVETDGTSDLLAVTGGDLTLGGSLTIADLSKLVYPVYTIATYTGNRYGSFVGGNNLPGTWWVDYGTGSNSAITLVPEPATLVLLGLGGLGLILGRKRR